LLIAVPTICAAAAEDRALREFVGQVLYVLNATSVRTVGGSLSVDLLRGQAVVLISVSGDRAILTPGHAEASLLRAHGVRKPPRYRALTTQLTADFVTAPVWERARRDEVRRLRERWPDLTAESAGKIFIGEPFVGMTVEQAEEAVGPLVLSKEPVPGHDGSFAWKVGRRPRSSELRLFTEGRERGEHARTFEEFLASRARAILTLSGGLVVAIDPPDGQTSGLNWP
jgi:hypothetical protein